VRATLQRLPHALVDTAEPIEFEFEGRRYAGFAGDTLASALLANGVAVVGRSFKFHRPRGVFSAGCEEVNALVALAEGARAEPNARATQVPLYPGLQARGQNAWPTLQRDLGAGLGALRPLLPASFYYKTFQWPGWHFWAGFVRRLAGIGRVPALPDPQCYLKQNRHAEVLIVGAGRSGLGAALRESEDPARRVLLVDEQERPGGRLLASPDAADRDWLARTLETLAGRDNVTVLSRTTVDGYYDHNVLAALERCTDHRGPAAPTQQPRQRLWRFFAERVVLATGAIERPLVFPDNDRPGIMLADAVCQYAHRYGVVPGREIAFFSNNDSAWRRAIALAERGVPIAHIIDVRAAVDERLAAAAARVGIIQHLAHTVVATAGDPTLSRLCLRALDTGGRALLVGRKSIDCDLLALAGGWTPTVHLYSQAGGRLHWREGDACFVPAGCAQAVSVTGRAAGDFGVALNLQPYWLTPEGATNRQWVDFLYDVTVADIELAARENFVSIEHMKRYTTSGMAPDQGKTSNVNALAILAAVTDRDIPAVGTTRFRPPYQPMALGAFAGIERGSLHHPYRRLPAHEAHLALGARFEDYGGWQRPCCYPRYREREAEAVTREVNAVRHAVGLLDYSPLGKLELRGPDAREFLNRVYVNNMLTLVPGSGRYGLLLDERGIVMDDGVLVCIDDDHFLLYGSSGAAGAVHEHLEEWLQCEWPALELVVSDVCGAWATFMVSGPRAREVLARLGADIDLAADAFGPMQYRQGQLAGVPCRLLRAGFTGELTFEVSVPAGYGRALWEALMLAGQPLGITPFGIEALMVLRAEKGHAHVGTDTDGNTMPQDLGWARAIERQQTDFIGRRSLALSVGREPGRLQFTGIEPLQPSARLRDGAHVLTRDRSASAGYVTSACYSPTLHRTVALGLVADAHSREGEVVQVRYGRDTIAARLVKPGAYDPEGERLRD
jgi:sarcosine oxidase subunit alpha